MTPLTKTFRVGIIIGSQRVVRIGPQVAKFVRDAVETPSGQYAALQARTTVDLIDLKTYDLPLFDEPIIPNRVHSAEGYANEHTRVWSRLIASYDAFVFLSAQRNWGIPAELKNAIDYLFNEWKGKPAMLVTYGGHGGLRCAEHLRTVAGSIGMRVVDNMVNMSFPGRDVTSKAFAGEDMGLDATNDSGIWAEHRADIAAVFWHDMVEKLLLAQAQETPSI
jgi:NAD(P)H-dependent FMN reductase